MTTKTTEHTPGPWEARRQLADGYLIKKEGWEIRTDAYDVATWIEHGAPIRKEADARLMAAAPEMFAALEAQQELERCRARCFTTGGADEANMNAWSEAEKTAQTLRRAVIAKARGEQ